MASEVQRLKRLQQRLADANAELNVQEKRKLSIRKSLEKMGIKDIDDIPRAIARHEKKQKSLKKKLDKALDRLEDEFSDLRA